MAEPRKPSKLPQSSKPPQASSVPYIAKPWQRKFPTPSTDYIISVRKDTRAPGFVMPVKGDAFDGIDPRNQALGHTFAAPVALEQLPGFVDLYYLAPFQNQEDYNYTITFPFVDKSYPRFTRTYVVLRTDTLATDEPAADSFDPRFGTPYQLTDHKIERFDDNQVLDAVFVKVIRTYEKLPGPVITSYERNAAQQVVTVQTQEIASGAAPTQSALTEEAKQERVGTAKAKNTLATVASVFPATGLQSQIPSMTRELWLGGFVEYMQSQMVAGTAAQPTFNPGEYDKTEKQITAYKKETIAHSLPLPQTRVHYEVTTEFGGGTLEEDVQLVASGLSVPTGAWNITEARQRNLPGFGQIEITKTLDAANWPVLQGQLVHADGIYAGIKFVITKQFVKAGTQADGSGPPYTPNPSDPTPDAVTKGFTDMQEHDKWRTIQITTKVDPTTLPGVAGGPPAIVRATTVHLDLPAILTEVYGDFQTGSSSSWSINPDSLVATAIASVTAFGEIGHTLKEGYRGPAKGQITTLFFLAPPTLTDLAPYAITIIQPVVGTATIRGRHVSTGGTQVVGPTVTAQTGSIQDRIGRLELRPCMTGSYISSGIGPVQAPDTNAGQTGLGNDFVIFQSGSAATATITLKIPTSVGDALIVSGSTITISAVPEEWKLGIWVLEVTTAIVP